MIRHNNQVHNESSNFKFGAYEPFKQLKDNMLKNAPSTSNDHRAASLKQMIIKKA